MPIKFTLSKELQTMDSLGVDYIYEATEHPTVTDLMVIHFKENGQSSSTNYTKKEFDEKFQAGKWLKV